MGSIGIFLLTLFISTMLLFYVFPLIVGPGEDAAVTVVGIVLILIGSFIITQLFYIIEVLKKNNI